MHRPSRRGEFLFYLITTVTALLRAPLTRFRAGRHYHSIHLYPTHRSSSDGRPSPRSPLPTAAIGVVVEIGGRAIHATFLGSSNSRRTPDERWESAPELVRASFRNEFAAAVRAAVAAGWEIRRKR